MLFRTLTTLLLLGLAAAVAAQDSDGELTKVKEQELEEVREEFGDQRRTEILRDRLDLTLEDLITEEDRVVTISHGGYAKTQPLSDYQAQRRGGMGKSATAVKDEDFVEHLLIASTHATILCFSNLGKVYWLKVYQIPLAGRNSRGRPMVSSNSSCSVTRAPSGRQIAAPLFPSNVTRLNVRRPSSESQTSVSSPSVSVMSSDSPEGDMRGT